MLTRREFGTLALTAFPALQLPRRPNSVINGVNVGTITYSYRSMPDQSAEAILRYTLDSGINQIEFMGGPVEAFGGGAAPPAGRGRPGARSPAREGRRQGPLREGARGRAARRPCRSRGPFAQ